MSVRQGFGVRGSTKAWLVLGAALAGLVAFAELRADGVDLSDRWVWVTIMVCGAALVAVVQQLAAYRSYERSRHDAGIGARTPRRVRPAARVGDARRTWHHGPTVFVGNAGLVYFRLDRWQFDVVWPMPGAGPGRPRHRFNVAWSEITSIEFDDNRAAPHLGLFVYRSDGTSGSTPTRVCDAEVMGWIGWRLLARSIRRLSQGTLELTVPPLTWWLVHDLPLLTRQPVQRPTQSYP